MVRSRQFQKSQRVLHHGYEQDLGVQTKVKKLSAAKKAAPKKSAPKKAAPKKWAPKKSAPKK